MSRAKTDRVLTLVLWLAAHRGRTREEMCINHSLWVGGLDLGKGHPMMRAVVKIQQ